MNVCLLNAYAVDKYVFFFHAIPDDKEAMTLDELHSLVQDVWLARHDVALGEEQKSRRKGRPKSAKEMKLENIKLFESEEYRTGLGACTWPAFICIRYDAGRADVGTRLPHTEVPDLTHAPTVALYRRWDQKAIEYIDLLRFIRINSENTSTVVLTRPGKHELLKQPVSEQMALDA